MREKSTGMSLSAGYSRWRPRWFVPGRQVSPVRAVRGDRAACRHGLQPAAGGAIYRSDLWASERLAATLAALPGLILAPSYESYVTDPTALAPDPDAITEIIGSTSGGGGTPEGIKNWDAQYGEALQARRFSYIIVDPDVAAAIITEAAVAYGYKDVGPLFPAGDVYWAWRTGWAPRAEVYALP